MTQTKLAERTGVSVSAVSFWESGGAHGTEPTHENLAAVIKALDLTYDRFYGPLPRLTKAEQKFQGRARAAA